MKKILVCVPDPTNGIAYYRTQKPFEKLTSEFDITIIDFLETDSLLNGDYDEFDMVFFNRVLASSEELITVFDYLKNKNIITVCDMDDWWFPSKKHPSYDYYINGRIYDLVIQNMQLSDYIFSPSKFLIEEIHTWNTNTYYVPNAIDEDDPQFKPNYIKSNRLRIGWAGGSSHLEDIRITEKTIQEIYNSDLIDKVQFVLGGFDIRGQMFYEENGESKVRDLYPEESPYSQMEKIFSNGFSNTSEQYKEFLLRYKNEVYTGGYTNEPYRRIWSKPINKYGECYNHFDICIAPLYKGKFNDFKSNLKVIEAGFHNIPIIAQDCPTYNTSITNAYKNGRYYKSGNGLLVPHDNPSLFKDFLYKLISDESLYDSLSDNLTKYVKSEFTLNKVNEKRVDYLKEIFTKHC